jgi:hypothetical protein
MLEYRPVVRDIFRFVARQETRFAGGHTLLAFLRWRAVARAVVTVALSVIAVVGALPLFPSAAFIIFSHFECSLVDS